MFLTVVTADNIKCQELRNYKTVQENQLVIVLHNFPYYMPGLTGGPGGPGGPGTGMYMSFPSSEDFPGRPGGPGGPGGPMGPTGPGGPCTAGMLVDLVLAMSELLLPCNDQNTVQKYMTCSEGMTSM